MSSSMASETWFTTTTGALCLCDSFQSAWAISHSISARLMASLEL